MTLDRHLDPPDDRDVCAHCGDPLRDLDGLRLATGVFACCAYCADRWRMEHARTMRDRLLAGLDVRERPVAWLTFNADGQPTAAAVAVVLLDVVDIGAGVFVAEADDEDGTEFHFSADDVERLEWVGLC